MVDTHQKGASYERKVASMFVENGFTGARRGYLVCGEPDVTGVEFVHIECKNREKVEVNKWMHQAERDAKENEIPVVFHHRNHQGDVVIVPVSWFFKLLSAWYETKK